MEEDFEKGLKVTVRAPSFSPTSFLVDIQENWMNERAFQEMTRAYRIPPIVPVQAPQPDKLFSLPFEVGVVLSIAVFYCGLSLPLKVEVHQLLLSCRVTSGQSALNPWWVIFRFLILWNKLGFPQSSPRNFEAYIVLRTREKRRAASIPCAPKLSRWCQVSLFLPKMESNILPGWRDLETRPSKPAQGPQKRLFIKRSGLCSL